MLDPRRQKAQLQFEKLRLILGRESDRVYHRIVCAGPEAASAVAIGDVPGLIGGVDAVTRDVLLVHKLGGEGFTGRVDGLGNLHPEREVGPDDHVVGERVSS